MALDFSITPCGFVQNDTEKEEIPAFAGMTSVGAGGTNVFVRLMNLCMLIIKSL